MIRTSLSDIDYVIDEVSRASSIDRMTIFSKSRFRPVVVARHAAIRLIRRTCKDLTISDIGRAIEFHSTTARYALGLSRRKPNNSVSLDVEKLVSELVEVVDRSLSERRKNREDQRRIDIRSS